MLGGQAGVNVFSEASDPVSVATAGLEEAKRLGRDVLIVGSELIVADVHLELDVGA